MIFAFVGAEIVTIAAAESDEPERAVARATNQVVGRVLVFYVLAIFLIVCIVPWNNAKLGDSPFIAALDRIGIPGSADIMNAIVVTAVLSCLNSGIYVASRMLFALARRGDAPKSLLEVNDRGVPVKAILLSVSVGFVSVIFDAISPDKVFLFLVNSSGAVALFCYLLIAVAELRTRRRLEAEAPERLKLRMWLFPWLTLRVDRGDGGRDRRDGAGRRACARSSSRASSRWPSCWRRAGCATARAARGRASGGLSRAARSPWRRRRRARRCAARRRWTSCPRWCGSSRRGRRTRRCRRGAPPQTMRSPGLGRTPGPAGVARPVRWPHA